MAKATWNQAGGQVQAAKLMSYGDALKPAMDWAQRAVKTENRKKEIQKKNDFLTEREDIKNQWTRDAAEKQRTFTASENEASRALTRTANQTTADHYSAVEEIQRQQANTADKRANADISYKNGMLGLRNKELELKRAERAANAEERSAKVEERKAKAAKENETKQASMNLLNSIYGTQTPMKDAVVGKKSERNIEAEGTVASKYNKDFEKIGKNALKSLDSMAPEIRKMTEAGATRDDVVKAVSKKVVKLSKNAGEEPAYVKGFTRANSRAAKQAGLTNIEYAISRGWQDRITNGYDPQRVGSKRIKDKKTLAKVKRSLSAYDNFKKNEEAAKVLQNKMTGEVNGVRKIEKDVYGKVVDNDALYKQNIEKKNSILSSLPLIAGSKDSLSAAKLALGDLSSKIKSYEERKNSIKVEKAKGDNSIKEIAAEKRKKDYESAQKKYDALVEKDDSKVRSISFSTWYKREYEAK